MRCCRVGRWQARESQGFLRSRSREAGPTQWKRPFGHRSVPVATSPSSRIFSALFSAEAELCRGRRPAPQVQERGEIKLGYPVAGIGYSTTPGFIGGLVKKKAADILGLWVRKKLAFPNPAYELFYDSRWLAQH
jgi:hypothetical protein